MFWIPYEISYIYIFSYWFRKHDVISRWVEINVLSLDWKGNWSIYTFVFSSDSNINNNDYKTIKISSSTTKK